MRASPERLRSHVEALEGERNDRAPGSKERALRHVVSSFRDAGLAPELEPFTFQGEVHHNVVARVVGEDPTVPRVLIGAHLDTVPGSPGADDNGSGVAGVLESARLLAGGSFRATVELAVFDLEEQQLYTYRVGSRRHTARARREGVAYAGGLIYEMIGFASSEPGSQRVPLLVRWRDVPRTGDFVAVVGDWKSGELVRGFREAADAVAPELDVVTHRTPFRGWLVWQTRLSDNASFWSDGYPALMITDTAFLRNPYYHTIRDTADTLDFTFMARVVDAATELARRLAS